MPVEHIEEVSGGLRFRETSGDVDIRHRLHPFLRAGWAANRLPARFCELVSPAGETLSYLAAFGYRLRFGACALAVEGFGGVATPPRFRRRGYSRSLIEQSLSRAAARAPAVFLHGIENYYGAFGFVPCFVTGEATLEVRHGERARAWPECRLRAIEASDLAAVCDVFNREHHCRPGAVERAAATFGGGAAPDDWSAGDGTLLLERASDVLGYAIFSGERFGMPPELTVREASAVSARAAEALVRELVAVATTRRVERLTLHVAPDSIVGGVLRRLGCKMTIHYPATGGWMGKVLDRRRLVEALGDELRRRAPETAPHDLAALAAGEIYPDDALLLPLLTGYLTWRDADAAGASRPEGPEELAARWFPGGGGIGLPLPFMHRLDYY
jgi:hypothetical protein